jgi:hypothetical protein
LPNEKTKTHRGDYCTTTLLPAPTSVIVIIGDIGNDLGRFGQAAPRLTMLLSVPGDTRSPRDPLSKSYKNVPTLSGRI